MGSISGLEGLRPGAPRAAAFDTYLRWNAAVAEVVFGTENAGIPVYLDPDEDCLDKIAKQAGMSDMSPRDALVEAVRNTLGGPRSPGGIFGPHLARLRPRLWDRGSAEPPPHLALLAVLSLAAASMHEGDGFASNNYYDRLMPLLGYQSEEDKARIIRLYRDCSWQLWGALNAWLEGLDGARGLPTAYPRTHAHVGPPLSQALLRATDRARLPALFADLNLAPRSHMGPADMELHIDEWMHRSDSHVSNTLRAMWQSPDARPRIVDCALQLLETWDGTGPAVAPGAAEVRHRLQLTALLRSFPSSALQLNVLGAVAGEEAQEVELIGATSGEGREALLQVEAASGSRWRLADLTSVDTGSLLEGRLRLRREGTIFERRPRRVVPMCLDELLQCFAEVERLPLGDPSLVLCLSDVAEMVGEALAVIARPGFVRHDAIAGCPPGWVLFSSVSVLGELPDRNARTDQPWRFELNVLQPLTSSRVTFTGGLRLPGAPRTFSSLAPPEITVVAGSQGQVRLQLQARRSPRADPLVVPDPSAEGVMVDKTFGQSTGVLPVEALHLPDGDYDVTATLRRPGGDLGLDAMRLRLRSADWLGSAKTEPSLARSLADPALAVLGASHDPHGPRVQGARLLDAGSVPSASLAGSETFLPGWWSERQAEGDATAAASSSGAVRVPDADPEDCFLTGYHHMDLPKYYGKPQRSMIRGVCRHCGLVRRYPPTLWAKPASPKARTVVASPRFDVTGLTPMGAGTLIDANVAFDGLCHVGAGRIGTLEQLSMQVEPSRLYLYRLVRGLEALAHIEVTRSDRSLEVVEWEVSAPTLVQLPNGSFVLSGHRGVCLLSEMAPLVEELGAEMDRTAQEAAPDRIRIRGLDLDQATWLCARLSHALAREVAVVTDAALSVGAALPPLSSVISRLERQAMPGARSLRRWDAAAARWRAATDASLPGAYQLSGTGTSYAIRDAEDVRAGTMVRCDDRLAKHAAALRAAQPMIGYHAETKTLYVPLGAELPFLYARAATLASGLVATADAKQGLVTYVGVPPQLARLLMAAMAT